MRLAVVAVPEPTSARTISIVLPDVPEGVAHELNGGCGVGGKDEVEMGGVGA